MNDEKTLTTADFAAAGQREQQVGARRVAEAEPVDERDRRDVAGMQRESRETGMNGAPPTGEGRPQEERLAPLFLPQMAQKFRSQWDEVQGSFVDDPTQAVKRADELVAQVMKNLAQTFADERAQIEGQLDQADTEHLRVALRRYRSFFQRLLAL